MKKVVATISAVLVLGVAGAASAAGSTAGSSSRCMDGSERTRTFDVKVKVLDEVYRLGEKAEFQVRVHRVVDGQDLGPVEGADVAVGIELGDVYLIDGGTTDAQGKASVKVALKQYARPGLADVTATASKLVAADVPCHFGDEYEYGDTKKPGLFRVVR